MVPAHHQPSGASAVTARIVTRTDSGFTFQVQIPYKGSMLEAENAIQDALNQAGVMATAEVVKHFDADGRPMTIADTKLTSKGRRRDEGTWGWDETGGQHFRRRNILGWSQGRRYQGVTGAYRTDGPVVPDLIYATTSTINSLHEGRNGRPSFSEWVDDRPLPSTPAGYWGLPASPRSQDLKLTVSTRSRARHGAREETASRASNRSSR
jgi:hypothetical protein